VLHSHIIHQTLVNISSVMFSQLIKNGIQLIKFRCTEKQEIVYLNAAGKYQIIVDDQLMNVI